MTEKGWLLDAYIKGRYAILLLKTLDGHIQVLRDRYRPDFYIMPKQGVEVEELAAKIEEHPAVSDIRKTERWATLRRKRRTEVAHVRVSSAKGLPGVTSFIKRLRETKALYNIGLTPVQWYLFRRKVAPSDMVEWSQSGEILNEIGSVDDGMAIEPPPFEPLIFTTKKTNSIGSIVFHDEDLTPIHTLEGNEFDVISRFVKLVEEQDPDFLVSEDVNATLQRIISRGSRHGLDIKLGRCGETLLGRVRLDLHTFMGAGIVGVVERARFTMAPMGMCADWPAGKTIDSRQCYEADRLGILVPEMRGGYGYVSTAWDLVCRDRGGLILSPQMGLHENVGCLDFESMFPNIIVHKNVSYETVGPEGVDQTVPGFMGGFTRPFLSRRLHFKHLRRKFKQDNQEWLWCEQRQNELKLFLVCIYGYSGCYANRFGNVRVFQEINRIARRVMVQSMNIALSQDFEVIYGHSDSLFTKKSDASQQDYEVLATEIEAATGLPIRLDRHFRFLVLLPKASDPRMEATNRYYGKLTDGSLFYRGIELRRHDTPEFIKRFQEELMEILFDAESSGEVLERQLSEALKFFKEAYMKISRGEVEPGELVISKRLRRAPNEYVSKQPHVVAAELGAEEGNLVNYLFVDARRRNPYLRVMPASMLNSGHHSYDKRKYVELVQRAAENLLRPIAPDGLKGGSKRWVNPPRFWGCPPG